MVAPATPSTTSNIVAIPDSAGKDQRAFCTDESAAIRFSEDGSAVTCLDGGEPVP